MRFKTFINEAIFSPAKLEKVVNLLVGSISKRIGQKFWKFGGPGYIEHYKRSDGTKGTGIPFILDSGRMVRFNLDDKADSSELSSVDIWLDLKNPNKPKTTLQVPSEFNSVEAVNAISEFIKSLRFSLKESLFEGRRPITADREELSQKYGIPDTLSDDEFKNAVAAAKKYLQLTGKEEISTLTQEIENAQVLAKKAKIDPAELFQDLEDLVHLVATGSQPSLVITGGAGTGKTTMVTNELTKLIGPEGSEWNKVAGKTSTLGLYGALFVNRNKIVVFDDCDSVFGNQDAINILKAALDSGKNRVVSWVSPSTINTALMDPSQRDELYASIEDSLEQGYTDVKFPSKFEFTGKVIFISNLPESKVDDAIKSRSFVIDVTLDNEAMLERMKQILPHLCKEASMADKQEVLEFLVTDGSKLNMRTFVNAIRVKQSGNPRWQRIVKNYA